MFDVNLEFSLFYLITIILNIWQGYTVCLDQNIAHIKSYPFGFCSRAFSRTHNEQKTSLFIVRYRSSSRLFFGLLDVINLSSSLFRSLSMRPRLGSALACPCSGPPWRARSDPGSAVPARPLVPRPRRHPGEEHRTRAQDNRVRLRFGGQLHGTCGEYNSKCICILRNVFEILLASTVPNCLWKCSDCSIFPADTYGLA